MTDIGLKALRTSLPEASPLQSSPEGGWQPSNKYHMSFVNIPLTERPNRSPAAGGPALLSTMLSANHSILTVEGWGLSPRAGGPCRSPVPTWLLSFSRAGGVLGAWVRRHPSQKILGSGPMGQPASVAQHLSSTAVPPRCTVISLCACCAGVYSSAAVGTRLALQPDSSPLEAEPLWAAGSCSICLASRRRLSLGCCSVL